MDKGFFSDIKKTAPLLLLVVALVLVTVSYLPKKETAEEKDELSEYSSMLEMGLKEVLSKMVDDDSLEVFVTLESSFENVYASDATVNEQDSSGLFESTSQKQIVLAGSVSGQKEALVVKRIPPKVKGAAVVCRGGDDAELKRKITALAAAVLGVAENRIYVSGGN